MDSTSYSKYILQLFRTLAGVVRFVCVWFGNEFDYLNDWLEIGNPKDEMENE